MAIVTSNRTPNFPKPPTPKPSSIISMPSDLIANGRDYYTEIFFQDFRTAKYGKGSSMATNLNEGFTGGTLGPVGGGVAGGIVGAVSGVLNGNIFSAIGGAVTGGFIGTQLVNSGGAVSTSAVRLPIPNKINDMLTMNWQQHSATDLLGSIVPGLSQAVQVTNTVGPFIGKAVNPLLYLAFNTQEFREFSFDWVLAPKNKEESDIVKFIISLFKNSALPTKGYVMDYPLIATVVMSPKDLNGHAKFKPMAITSVAANYTPNPTPSFFENTGAPTIVTLSVRFKEIELWFRNDRGI